ncbi:hypothetical protein L7F22_017551 [Adiantum nelumboides]|nr:hypothetical protein [Adiantum nelumboides]
MIARAITQAKKEADKALNVEVRKMSEKMKQMEDNIKGLTEEKDAWKKAFEELQEGINHLRISKEEGEISSFDDIEVEIKNKWKADIKEEIQTEMEAKQSGWVEVVKKNIKKETGNDGIWTIICRFSKQAHFIPIRKKIKPDQMACLFMSNIFKYHGMPQSIVSDRDPHMTSLFWIGLFENMGTTLKFSSSFHPQTDGQSEEANSTVLDLLKCYVSEHKGKWEQYLPLVEYAYNNTMHSSTGKAPFEIVEGGKKVPPILHTKDKIFEADKYVQDMDDCHKTGSANLSKNT